MFGGYNINSFRKRIIISKDCILESMIRNPIYAQYVPDNTNPKKITRAFLLTVSNINIY